ncbi:hypothetical protein HGRIS_013363 [Hohenbuehelia grisea]|uniref:HCP-like protein n=1 Tax=Hohenbuehelia grisea TaxID=104357 RepID=A0ABR3IVB5_9AGAR
MAEQSARESLDEFRPPPKLMLNSNHSVPSLPSRQPDDAPPLPDYDPTDVLDKFSAMRIAGHPAQHPQDPVPRAGSSMSHRPLQHTSPRHAYTLPSAPNQGLPQRAPHPSEGPSAYSRHSGGSQYNGAYAGYEGDQSSVYSYDDQSNGFSSPESVGPHGGYRHPQQYQPYPSGPAPPQQPWQTSPNPSDYNLLYAAASDVLGMGPPPGAMQPAPQVASGYAPRSSYADSAISLPSSYSVPHPTQPSGYAPPPQQDGPYAQSVHSFENQDYGSRPTLQRSGTTASVKLTTSKTKAIDLSAPPYTREYIDQYRQRIKADPDPESHFLYAKYLIDAAKKIRAGGKDNRGAKKYSEMLITESLKVVRRLATQGDAYGEAQFFLANCYGTGALGLQVDHERAYHLYLQAAKQNHAAACYRVAVCNEIGAGTRKEPPRAAAFYRKAASLGDTAAMYKLGMILLNGSLGEGRNPREAINWLKRAAEQADEENPHALHELGLLHEQQDSQLVMHDPTYARNLFTQAAQLGYTQSQFRLGQCYEYGALGCPVDPRRSIAWYTKAAEKGDAEAELALSGWYLTGSEGVLKQSDSEAYLWARRAANKGLSKAEYAVGYYAEVGIGIKQDIEFAKRWYMRAAAQGNKRAMNRLTEMKRMGNKRMHVARPTRQQAGDECVIC